LKSRLATGLINRLPYAQHSDGSRPVLVPDGAERARPPGLAAFSVPFGEPGRPGVPAPFACSGMFWQNIRQCHGTIRWPGPTRAASPGPEARAPGARAVSDCDGHREFSSQSLALKLAQLRRPGRGRVR